ncbi:MAG: hypothetical protein M1818_000994 [Claussenomyces sp. TS43310]|nr:MAG: hypothetical protein M1818_000994 [Claussenomyces sp. TS43310]
MGSQGIQVRHVDVLIVGGGPVGLVTAYQLSRFGGLRTALIEKHTKSSQDQYGRAITLYPRSSEILDQLGLADDLAQECFACRETVSYDPQGKEVMGRGWYFMENMKDTQWDFALVLRQKYQEEIFRRRLREEGGSLEAPAELLSVDVRENLPHDSYKVTATVRNSVSGIVEEIQCKYLIGADGGRSFVRRAVEIPFDGETSEDQWVRIDGIVETDMPKTRVYGSIESPTHGNVLWAALDHGATRLGFAYTADRQKAHKEFNEAAAVAEAIASVKPFKLEFKEVHWFTIYSVGQRIARQFFTKQAVFLAGDACHTHSSGAAQGMNTGMHDAVNLSWKLSLVLKGLALPLLLDTYESERLPNVEKLINYDKDISRLMTMQLPVGWKGDPKADPNEILGQVMEEASTFTSGLSIAFQDNILNVRGSFISVVNPPPVSQGHRGPDVQLQRPGTRETTRLHRETPNVSRFHVVVFAGQPEDTAPSLSKLRKEVDDSQVFGNARLPISWITVVGQMGPSVFELLGIMPFGKAFFDQTKTAHARYGVDVKRGAVFVLRPDGWVGTAAELGQTTVGELESYFGRFMINR